MRIAHEASIAVAAPVPKVWAHWSEITRLPLLLSHLRATALDDCADLARLVIVLDGRHIEFAAQQTMKTDETICWQSLGDTFLYVLSVSVRADSAEQSALTVNVAYDPPGFLPDIAESLGTRRTFRKTLDRDLKRYAESVVSPQLSLVPEFS